MDKLKSNWFVIINIVIFIATLVVYFMGVSGATAQEVTSENKLEAGLRNLDALAGKKPTEEWYKLLDENVKVLEEDKKAILDKVVASDALIHRYFDLDARSSIVFNAPNGRYPEFKEMMQEKWNALIARFCSEGSPFICKADKFSGLEPPWLRTAATPSLISEVSRAMKRYWIVLEMFERLEKVGISSLEKITLGSVVEDPNYNKEKLFWGLRTMDISLIMENKKVMDLMKEIHDSPMLFRITGFDIKNITTTPEGVVSDADFISFGGAELQRVSLTLQHYDYVQEGENLGVSAGVGGAKVIDARAQRRGGR